uniref:Uncharacterized protein n=1 Tax=Sphaerodactylus townsendi TaxID=933632 RepID=A0ACB8G0S9_9SAUR
MTVHLKMASTRSEVTTQLSPGRLEAGEGNRSFIPSTLLPASSCDLWLLSQGRSVGHMRRPEQDLNASV